MIYWGRCDFQPGFAAFDHDYNSFIFFRLPCHLAVAVTLFVMMYCTTILARVTIE